MGGMWVCYFIQEANQQSKQWAQSCLASQKKAKTVPSAGKVMETVFWDVCGTIIVEYLKNGQAINDAP